MNEVALIEGLEYFQKFTGNVFTQEEREYWITELKWAYHLHMLDTGIELSSLDIDQLRYVIRFSIPEEEGEEHWQEQIEYFVELIQGYSNDKGM